MTEKNTYKYFSLDLRPDNTAWVTIDLPGEKVNKLTSSVMQELALLVSELSTIYSLRAIFFVSKKPNIFIAGADIKEIEGITDPEDGEQKAITGQKIFNMVEQLEIPTVAVIDGACLGGGMEFALACTYRVATDNPKTKLGQPEVLLGIIPGFGGTQRMPRLVGIENALDLIVSGRSVNPRQAKRMGLVDEVVPSPIASDAALQFITKRLDKFSTKNGGRKEKRRFRPRGIRAWLLEGNPIGRSLLFRIAKKTTVQKTRGNYPAPLKAIDAIFATQFLGLEKGLAREAKLFAPLVATPECKNLIRVFYLQEDLKKQTASRPEVGTTPHPIQKAGVLGAGIMGAGIAGLLAAHGIPVRMKDINWEMLTKGYGSIAKSIHKQLKRKRVSREEARATLERVTLATDYSGLKNTTVVIEAAPEVMDLKKKILGELAQNTNSETIIASNTSSLSVDAMAEVVSHPERVIGMHFFNPVEKMPLVEVIVGEKSSPESIATITALTKLLGKTPVVVKNKAGFLVNRVLMPYMNEAAFLVEEGMPIEEIDRIMLDFGMPMGPIDLFDEVGLDITVHAGRTLYEAFGERMHPAEIVPALVEAKRLGKKSGMGFYIHIGKKKKPDQNGVETILRHLRQNGKSSKARKVSYTEALARMTLIMVNEAIRCVEEGVVKSANDADAAMIFGTGFAPFRGGPLRYADELGVRIVRERLETLQKKFGIRFEPAQLLVKHSRENRKFTI